jgi:adenylate cyclase
MGFHPWSELTQIHVIIKRGRFHIRFLDFVRVKGKNIPVKVYELVSAKNNADNHTVNLIKVFEEGLDHYYQQQWDKALIHFEKAEGVVLRDVK